MLQFKRYGLVAHGADQHPVGGVTLRPEHVIAHHTLATHWNPQIRSLRSAQGSPSNIKLTGIIHLKNRGANGLASLSPDSLRHRTSGLLRTLPAALGMRSVIRGPRLLWRRGLRGGWVW